MTKLRTLLLASALCFVLQAPGVREGADALAREADEGATTVEARQSALADLLAAARQYRDAGQTLEAARAMNRAGRLQLKLNSPQDALATYKEALALLEQMPDAQTSVESLNGLGETYSDLSGKCDEAQDVLRRSIALSEQIGYAAGKAEALLTLADCQNYSDPALALRTAQEALALWQSVGSRRGVAQAYADIGHYHLAQSDVTEAAQSFEAALSRWRELDDPDEQAEALINLGFIEYRKGAWQNSLAFYTQAQALLDENADPYKMGQINAGLAGAFIESGMPDTGLAKYREALEYYRQAKYERATNLMTWGIGRTYYLLGNYP